MVWLAVPNGACRSARKLEWHWYSTDLPVHLMHFSPASVRVAAERAGLNVERLYTVSPAWAVRDSLCLELRVRWLIPHRISHRLLSTKSIQSYADRIDRETNGEAIIVELKGVAQDVTH